jgi:hypothetical protein
MSWQGYLRALSQNYDKIVVCAPQEHEVLYEDFCTEFIGHSLVGLSDCCLFTPATQEDKESLTALKEELASVDGHIVRPTSSITINRQNFIQFGDSTHCTEEDRFDILIHAREPIGKHKDHSYPVEKWDEVLAPIHKKYRIGAIGTKAYCPKWAEDRRNIPLSRLMDMMAACGMVVGPSSGPMHLASLCGANHLVWSDAAVNSAIKSTNKARYEKVWNPLKTPCVVLESGWNPEPSAVTVAIRECAHKWL